MMPSSFFFSWKAAPKRRRDHASVRNIPECSAAPPQALPTLQAVTMRVGVGVSPRQNDLALLLEQRHLHVSAAHFLRVDVTTMDDLVNIIDVGEWPRLSSGVPISELAGVLRLVRGYKQSLQDPGTARNFNPRTTSRSAANSVRNMVQEAVAVHSQMTDRLQLFQSRFAWVESYCHCGVLEGMQRGNIVVAWESYVREDVIPLLGRIAQAYVDEREASRQVLITLDRSCRCDIGLAALEEHESVDRSWMTVSRHYEVTTLCGIASANPHFPLGHAGFGFSATALLRSLPLTVTDTLVRLQTVTATHKYVGAVFDGTSVWMCPCSARSVLRIRGDQVEALKVAWPKALQKKALMFRGGVFDGRYIWFVPCESSELVRIHCGTAQVDTVATYPSHLSTVAHAFSGGVFDGAYVWLIPSEAPSIVKINVITDEVTVLVTTAGWIWQGIVLWWLFRWSAGVACPIWSKRGGCRGQGHRLSEYLFLEGGRKSPEVFISGANCDGSNVWFVPFMAPYLLSITTATGLVRLFDRWPTGVLWRNF